MRGPTRLIAATLLGLLLFYLILSTTGSTAARPSTLPHAWGKIAQYNPVGHLRQPPKPSIVPDSAASDALSHLQVEASQLQAAQLQAELIDAQALAAPTRTAVGLPNLPGANDAVPPLRSSTTSTTSTPATSSASSETTSSVAPTPPPRATPPTRALVMAKPANVDAHWIQPELSSWDTTIYNITNTSSSIDLANPPRDFEFPSKGGASVAFLTWIIDNYSNLPDVIFFISALPPAGGLREGAILGVRNIAPTLHAVNSTYVLHQNFTSMRCNVEPGCATPSEEVRPLLSSIDPARAWQKEIIGAWQALNLGNTAVPVPERIANPPGTQFAVSKAQVQSQSREQYESVRSWVNSSPLGEDILSLVMESMWHLVLGRPGLDCPDDRICLCDFYGKECLEDDDDDNDNDEYQASLSPSWSDLREGKRRKKKKWSTWFGRS